MIRSLILISFLPFIFGDCPENGIKWQTKCYIFNPKGVAFVTADMNCNKLGGHLSSVHDGFTNAFLAQEGLSEFKKSKHPDFWIGITNLIIPGNWSWTDGSVYDFSDWRESKQKSKSGQSCGAINIHDGLWNSDDCFKAKPYVCEVDDGVAPVTSAAPKPLTTTTTTITATATTPSPAATTAAAAATCAFKSTEAPETTTVIPESTANWFLTSEYFDQVDNCPTGWRYFESTAACYILTSPNLSWAQAEAECVSHNTHLASIHSADELSVIQALNGGWAWVGLHSNDNETTWQWTDNTVFDYAPWATSMPQAFTYTCVHALNYIHNDWQCSNPIFGVCKKCAFD